MKKEINIYDYLPMKLKAKDISTNFNIGLSTVWLYARQNKLKATKISKGCTLFDTNVVVEFFNGK